MHSPPACQYVPGAQIAHDCVAVTVYKPAEQFEFAGRQLAPSMSLSRPAAHGRHRLASAAPTATEYLPGAQIVQSEIDVAPAVELKRPGGHELHDVAPGAAKDPRGQHVAAPELDDVPNEHAEHCAEEDRAVAALLRPDAQSRHAEGSTLRGAGLYVPSGQACIAAAPFGQ